MTNSPENFERWQGQVDARLTELERRAELSPLLSEAITAIRVDIATLKAQIRFWSAIGGTGMAGVASLLVALILKG